MYKNSVIAIGINAIDLKSGGGKIFIQNLVHYLISRKYKIVIWCSVETAAAFKKQDNIEIIHHKFFDQESWKRIIWQILFLRRSFKESGCSTMILPGGINYGLIKESICVVLNSLPFDTPIKRKQHFFSRARIRNELLYFAVKFSLKFAKKSLYLNQYSFELVKGKHVLPNKDTIIASYGPEKLSEDYQIKCISSDAFNNNNLNIVYVSPLLFYKNHFNVLKAVYNLNNSRPFNQIKLHFVGPSIEEGIHQSIMSFVNEKKISWLIMHGNINRKSLYELLNKCNLGIFASSCENLPNILLEYMQIGLPVVCSRIRPMTDILKNGGIYFDPSSSDEISEAINFALQNETILKEKVKISQNNLKSYTWENFIENLIMHL